MKTFHLKKSKNRFQEGYTIGMQLDTCIQFELIGSSENNNIKYFTFINFIWSLKDYNTTHGFFNFWHRNF